MPEESPRVVFDCNIFLQGIANRDSSARQALRLFFDGSITLYVSEAVLAEIKDVLSRPGIRQKFPRLSTRLVEALLQKIEREAILIKNVPEEYHFERDPKDECYINLAIVTNAIYLVSRDNDLLDLMRTETAEARTFRTRYPMLTILDAPSFLNVIRAQQKAENRGDGA
jgi:uncharacterized protein